MDLGNTRLKWAFAERAADCRQAGAATWSDDIRAALAAEASGPREVGAASVVDEAREETVAAAVRECFGVPVNWVRTPREACGVRNAYAQPDTLGVDRFLSMVAAYADGHAPCVLVSCGTALVLDALAVG